MILLGSATISTMPLPYCCQETNIIGRQAGNSWEIATIYPKEYIDCHEGLHSTHCKFSLGIFREAMHTEIKPTLRIDPVMCLDSIINAAETVLNGRGSYMKLGHLPDELDVAGLETTFDMDVSLA